ncbi:hypothetical protein LXL04_015520 [Taraxacum kok-saghyz]
MTEIRNRYCGSVVRLIMDDGRVAVSNGIEPKSEFQESVVKSKLNRYVSNRDLESTESGWKRCQFALGTPLGSIGVAYGIEIRNW